MEPDDRKLWNRKYADSPEKWLEPDSFLVYAYEKFLSDRPPGRALDLAGGAGRHAIWLASQGWKVKIIDISDVGLRLAGENAAKALGTVRAGESITVEAADLHSTRDLGKELYDLVLVFRFLNRELFPALIRALKPNGTLIYSTYTIAQLNFAKGPREARFLLQPDELRGAFSQLEILSYQEKAESKGLAELVARKPVRTIGSAAPSPAVTGRKGKASRC
jgi:tellurite methyltransferase